MTTRESRFAVESLAEFVVAARPTDLSGEAGELLRRNVLDSLGCAIAALDGDTVRQVRAQIDAIGGTPRARPRDGEDRHQRRPADCAGPSAAARRVRRDRRGADPARGRANGNKSLLTCPYSLL